MSSSANHAPEIIELAVCVPLPLSSSSLRLQGPERDEAENYADSETQIEGSHQNESLLGPVDGGRGAWSFLFAAFMVETIVWGLPNAFGVFLEALLNEPRWANQRHATTLLPLTGTLASGIMYCSGKLYHSHCICFPLTALVVGPATYPVTNRWPRHRRTSMWLGLILCFCALVGASYATTVSIFRIA